MNCLSCQEGKFGSAISGDHKLMIYLFDRESQVNAPKTLRCNKVYHYVAERLNAINEAQNHRSKKKKLTAEDIDLVIMTDPEIGSLDYRMTVGTVKAYYAPRGDYGFWYSLRQKK